MYGRVTQNSRFIFKYCLYDLCYQLQINSLKQNRTEQKIQNCALITQLDDG